MQKTYFSYSLGCRVNQAELEVFDRQLINSGFTQKEFSADFYIINSCAVTAKAERETRQLIYKLKNNFPQAKIIVTGCAASLWNKNNHKNKYVDLLIDNQNKNNIAGIIRNHFNLYPDGSVITDRNIVQSKYFRSGRMLIKIQDGCHRFCSYCIVPGLRGLPKSTPINQIINQINKENNVNEVILTAVNTEAYGRDTNENLTDLMIKIMKYTGIKRISFGSIHPWSIDSKFTEFYKNNYLSNRMVRYLHIPLQSGSNKILKLMNRGYTREEWLIKLQSFRKTDPFVFLGTDIITGFLDETEPDFSETYDFLEKTPIVKFHVFRFSARRHTAAFYLKNKLTEPSDFQKRQRMHALIKLGMKKYHDFLEKHIGQTFSAMFIRKKDPLTNVATLINQIPVITMSSADLTGLIKNVKINAFVHGKLFGKIV